MRYKLLRQTIILTYVDTLWKIWALKFDVDAKGWDQTTALNHAALHGKIEVCRYLLARDANVDAVYQPLLAAGPQRRFVFSSLNPGKIGHLGICQLLLEHGANPLLIRANGDSVLVRACIHGCLPVCKLLYKFGARDELLYWSDDVVCMIAHP